MDFALKMPMADLAPEEGSSHASPPAPSLEAYLDFVAWFGEEIIVPFNRG